MGDLSESGLYLEGFNQKTKFFDMRHNKDWLNTKEAANFLGMQRKELVMRRREGKKWPKPYIKSGCISYRVTDLYCGQIWAEKFHD